MKWRIVPAFESWPKLSGFRQDPVRIPSSEKQPSDRDVEIGCYRRRVNSGELAPWLRGIDDLQEDREDVIQKPCFRRVSSGVLREQPLSFRRGAGEQMVKNLNGVTRFD